MLYADGDVLGDQKVKEKEHQDSLDSYVTQGNITLYEVGEDNPIMVFRDIGATQSLSLRKVLLRMEQGYISDIVLLWGCKCSLLSSIP